MGLLSLYLRYIRNLCSICSGRVYTTDSDSTIDNSMDISINSDIDRSITEFILTWERERKSLNRKSQSILGLNDDELRAINTAYYDKFDHGPESSLETYIKNYKTLRTCSNNTRQ